MNLTAARIVDQAGDALYALGWSAGEIAILQDGCRVWQVFAQRGDERIVVRARSQAAAWLEALKAARIVR